MLLQEIKTWVFQARDRKLLTSCSTLSFCFSSSRFFRSCCISTSALLHSSFRLVYNHWCPYITMQWKALSCKGFIISRQWNSLDTNGQKKVSVLLAWKCSHVIRFRFGHWWIWVLLLLFHFCCSTPTDDSANGCTVKSSTMGMQSMAHSLMIYSLLLILDRLLRSRLSVSEWFSRAFSFASSHFQAFVSTHRCLSDGYIACTQMQNLDVLLGYLPFSLRASNACWSCRILDDRPSFKAPRCLLW